MILLDTMASESTGLAALLEIAYNYVFDFFYNITPVGSLALSIIGFTVIIKLLLVPLSVKQQKSLLMNQKIQPELTALQNKYKDKKDQESQRKMAEEMQAIYSKYNSNPFAGCLLPFLQIPIILALFTVLKNASTGITKISTIYTSLAEHVMKVPGYETLLANLAKAKKMTGQVDYTVLKNIKNLFTTLTTQDWSALIGDMSNSLDVNAVNNLIDQKTQIESFFGINLINQPTLMSISIILPILTVLVTYFSINMATKTQSTEGMDEKAQAMIKNMNTMNIFMLGMIFVSALSLPAGLSLYWTLSNLWQFVQQRLIKSYFEKHPVDADKEASKNDKNKDAVDVKFKDVK